MMSAVSITIFQPTDALIISLFKEIETILGGKSFVSISVINDKLSIDNELINNIISYKSSIINNIYLENKSIAIYYYSLQVEGVTRNVLVNHPFYCTIKITYPDNLSSENINTDTVILVHTKINEFLKKKKLLPSGNASILETDELTANNVLSAIQVSASDQVNRVNQFFADFATKIQDEETNLRKRYDDKRLDLETQYQEKNEELAKKIKEKEDLISQAEEEIRQRSLELDDRDHMHARRAIREELIQTVQLRQTSFEIDPETRMLRKPIHLIFQLLLLATGVGAVYSLYIWGSMPPDSWGAATITSALKTSLFTIGFATTASLYISWLNRWFDKHADAQFQTRQFEIDINRATWAVEAALEWQNLRGDEMPEVLLEGITKNLFDRPNHEGETVQYSPLAALGASIAGSAGAVELNVNGNKLSFTKKELGKMMNDQKKVDAKT